MRLLHKHRGFGNSVKDSIAYIGQWWLGGNFQNLSNPNSLWYNGSTYVVGFEDNNTYNKVWIVKQTGYDEPQYNSVGNGTIAVGMEPNNHPTPLLHIDNDGYIYVFQNEYHVYPFRMWKSDNPEDISSFTEVGSFGNSLSYLGVLKKDNKSMAFISRYGGANNYTQAIVEVNLDSIGTYTQKIITESDWAANATRHYPILPERYGTSNYYVGGIAHRLDTPVVNYYKVSAWVTEDFDTFYNLDMSFSKTISVDGVITNAELEAHFAIVGTDSNRGAERGTGMITQIDNEIFIMVVKEDESTHQLRKYTIGVGLNTTFDIPVTLNYGYDGGGVDGIMWDYMYYNGSKILFTAVQIDGGDQFLKMFSIDKNLTEFSIRYIYDNYSNAPTGYGLYIGLPSNFNEIPINQNYMVMGRCLIPEEKGAVPYRVMSNKFL